MSRKLRTDKGRQVCLMNIDATDVKVDKSMDAFAQMQSFSGDRQKGHCYLFSNVTCSKGSILAVTPGPNVACSPRGGDGVSLGVHLGIAQQRDPLRDPLLDPDTGLPRLLGGSQNIGVGLVFDQGYVYQPNVNRGSNPTLLEYCEDNDILPIYRVKPGGFGFSYNRETELLERTPNNGDETRASNTGRVNTYLRAMSEGTHGAMKNGYKMFKHQVHNSHLVAVGQAKINHYNQLFGRQYGAEWAEMPKLNIEYLVMCGLFNRFHAKFAR